MILKFKPKLRIPVIADWEARISDFLQKAIAQPHLEPEICEELIDYIIFLVKQDRRQYRLKLFQILYRSKFDE